MLQIILSVLTALHRIAQRKSKRKLTDKKNFVRYNLVGIKIRGQSLFILIFIFCD